jgi:2Fe-2S ferredoxin
MPTLHVVDRKGNERTVEGDAGLSVMEVIRDNGFDELLALCGGSCSCATCHVHVDAEWHAKVGGPHPDEADLLDSSDHRNERSRLSCQIKFGPDLDGLRVTIAPED